MEMARRVLEFLQAHPFTDPTALEVQARFEEKLTRAEALAVDQRTHQLGAKAGNRRRNQLRRLLETGLMRHLVRVAEVADKELPARSGKILLPPQDGSNEAFLTAARSMVNAAGANHDLLVKHGMPEAMLDDLTHRLSDYEQAAEVAVGATRGRIN